MADDGDADQVELIRFIDQRVDTSDIDLEEDPDAIRDQIESAMLEYFVRFGVDSMDDHDIHYYSIVRIEDLITDSQEKYTSVVSEILVELIHEKDLDEDEAYEIAGRYGRYTIGNTVTLAYSTAYEMVDALLKDYLPEVLGDHVDEGTGDTLVGQLESFDAKLQVIGASGLLSAETIEGLWHIYNVRGDLVHDVTKRNTLEMFDELNEMNQVQEGINELYEAVYGHRAYNYVDE